MAQDAYQIYPPAAGQLSGATMGGFSPAAAMGFGMAAITPTSPNQYATSAPKSAGGIGFIVWTLTFLVGGLVLLHMGADK